MDRSKFDLSIFLFLDAFLIVLTFMLSAVCAVIAIVQPAWYWSDAEVKIEFSMARVKAPYKAALQESNPMKLVISKAGKPVFSRVVHSKQGFLVKGDAIFLLEYHFMSSGCSVEKIDLKNGKRVWIRPLEGIGPIDHSKYFNDVIIREEKGEIAVYGKESSGRYRETVDPKTGKSTSNYKFPR